MSATEVINTLRSTGWSDASIGLALQYSRSQIWRLRTGNSAISGPVARSLNDLLTMNDVALALKEGEPDDLETTDTSRDRELSNILFGDPVGESSDDGTELLQIIGLAD